MGYQQSMFRSLVREVDKILSAPYAVLFQPLLHTLSETDEFQVYVWTIAKDCQLEALVSRIIAGLDQDKAAWLVLLRLLKTRAFCDEVVRQDPGVLKKLFLNADESHVFETCISLCNDPFPESFAPPAGYVEFVCSILANKREETSLSWLDKVHAVLKHMSSEMLWIFEDDVIHACAGLWSEVSRTTDNLGFIKFISIAETVHRTVLLPQSFASECSTLSSTESKPLLAWKRKCSSLFVDQKALKITKAVLLRALYFISSKITIGHSDTLEAIDMIRQILSTVTPDMLRLAMSDQENVQIITKIAQKCMQDSLMTTTVRLCILDLLQIADPEHQFWDMNMLHSTFRQFTCDLLQPQSSSSQDAKLQTIHDLRFLYEYRDVVTRLARFAFSQSSLTQEILQHVINWCRPGIHTTVEISCRLQAVANFMDIISECLMRPEPWDNLSQCIVTIEIPNWWAWSFSLHKEPINCRALDTCHHSKSSMRQKLIHQFSDMVVQSACITEARLSPERYQLLREALWQGRDCDEAYRCQWAKPLAASGEHLDVVLGKLPPRNELGATEQLTGMLSDLNEQVSQIVSTYVDATCRDLQLRCQHVEEPLRVERAKSDRLANELTDVRGSLEVMAAEHQARRLSWQHEMEMVQQENIAFEDRFAEIESELGLQRTRLEAETDRVHLAECTNAELTAQCEALRDQLEQARAQDRSQKERYENMVLTNQSLQTQLHEAQDKESKMLIVLRGGQNTA